MRFVGETHWLVRMRREASYMLASTIDGQTVWGDRKRARRFEQWEARRVVREIRKLHPTWDVCAVKVAVYFRRKR